MTLTLAQRRMRLERAQPALQRLDVAMQRLRYDPTLPASVSAARARAAELTRELLADFHQDPLLSAIASALEAQYLEVIQLESAPERSAA